ncbi:hypothetical protein JTB14_021298 [Gonioctena quinquepunctata]|nr:hypothetical protein JTB14_021298 [Gonioctena quinquepunctata]
MDAFTENILVRARERQKMLKGYTSSEKMPLRETNSIDDVSQRDSLDIPKVHKESLSDSNLNSSCKSPLNKNRIENTTPSFSRSNSKTRVSSDIPGSPRSQLKTLNIQQDNFNMEIKVTSTDNVRVEVEIAEADDESDSGTDNETHENDNGLRDESKNKLKRLGKLYAGGDEVDISSPIHRTEAKFGVDDDLSGVPRERKDNPKSRKGLSRLANLAETINQWEDELHSVNKTENKSLKKGWKPPAPQPPSTSSTKSSPVKVSQKPKAPEPPVDRKCSPIKSRSKETDTTEENHTRQHVHGNNTTQVVGAIPKKLKWDPKVLDTLDKNVEVKTAQKKTVVKERQNFINEEDENSEESNVESLKNAIERTTAENKVKIVDKLCPPRIDKINKENGAGDKQCSPVKSKANLRCGNIADRAAAFESSPNKNTKDPALLSVSERKALFERNRGEALIPKAPFGMSHPVKVETTTKASSTKIITDRNVSPTSSYIQNINIETVKPAVHNSPRPVKKSAPKPPIETSSPTIAVVQQAGGIASKMAALLENKSTISQEQIEKRVKSERQKEMDMLLNRFNWQKDVTNKVIEEESDSEEEMEVSEKSSMITEKPAVVVNYNNGRRSGDKRKSTGKPYSKGDSPKVAAVLDDYKRIKVSPPKPPRLYPNLSDIEATTETETDVHTRSPSPDDDNSSCEENTESDDPNTSFGRDILEAVCRNQSPQKRVSSSKDDSTDSDISSVLNDMDNYLEENSSAGPTPPKLVKQLSPKKTTAQPSDSFSYKNFSPSIKETPKNKFKSPTKVRTSPQQNTDLPEYVVEGDNILPLTHTVSFYRKQQNQVQSPLRQVSRQPLLEEEETDKSETELVNKKMEELREEVNRQQNIISQTSQALNLCSCTPEFSGSTEQVEAERVLLVATHRRQAALHELQRLKVEQTIRPQDQHAKNLPLEKGTLTISNIVLPLKHKYVKALAAAGGKGHHVVCLVKCAEQVVPTKLVSTVVHNTKNPDTDLLIPGSLILDNIYSDFTVTFEVYCLQAQEEFLPHEVKYHINNKKSGNKLVTPKKSKQESRMFMPIKESPAGPQAVRTSSFALMGYVVFSVQAVNKRVWSLNNTPSMSPLDGTVEMRICCDLAVSVEHHGFLTMFEDVSGFGAWHRRWCLLKGHTLSYWKYPDDEKKTPPIDTIDLKNCITEKVGPVSREICARLHTFLFEREREAHPQDKESLVKICKGNKTITRHLLSADTKDDRIQWCEKFNAALTALRMWGGSQ